MAITIWIPRRVPNLLSLHIYAMENKYGKSVHKFWMAYLPGEPVDTIHRGGGRDTRGKLTVWCRAGGGAVVAHTISNSNQVSICTETHLFYCLYCVILPRCPFSSSLSVRF